MVIHPIKHNIGCKWKLINKIGLIESSIFRKDIKEPTDIGSLKLQLITNSLIIGFGLRGLLIAA